MSNWHAGYTFETAYTYGYYTELNPLRTQLLLLSRGIQPPGIGTACELGFGQGMTVNIHAAASGTRWYGTDFNPAQTAFAQELAEVSGNGAVLSEQSFQDFCARSDLPDFDYIALHGIWSWISPENQAHIADFLARKLKPGGVLYISYNTQAGWAAMTPLRDLMAQHSRVMSAPGQDALARVGSALSFVNSMMETKPRYLQANPTVALRLQQISEQDPNYLSHEYFNHYWEPVSFSAIQPVLAAVKLEYAGSAAYHDHVPPLNLSPEHMAFLAQIPDATFRETTADFLVNRQFRQDYWVKGSRKLNAFEQASALRAVRILLVAPVAQITMKVTGALGEADMDQAVYGPLLELLADYQPHTIGELQQRLPANVAELGALLQMLLVLAHKACIVSVQDDAAIALARPVTARLNHHLLNKARGRTDLVALASPVTGGGMGVYHLQQLFLLARMEGHDTPEAWVAFAWPYFRALQQTVVRNGTVLTTDEDNLAELAAHAESFRATTLPILQSLGVAE